MADFESLGVKAGVWSGLLNCDEKPGRVSLVHLGRVVAMGNISAAGEGVWRIEAEIPPSSLSDGIQTLLLLADNDEGDAPDPGAERLATLTLITGGLLNADIQAELTLLRGEVELIKREIRRMSSS